MRKHIILFFSALLFLFACNRGNSPDGILKPDVMVHLLTDVHIVDGSLALQTAGDSLYKYGTGKYNYLFKQYHTDSAQFKRSVKYYTTQPEILIKMYADVAALLQIKNDSLNKVVAKENSAKAKEVIEKAKKNAKLKADSLKRDSIIHPKHPKKIKKDTVKLKHKPTGVLKKYPN
ncbi:DUF4296 domain-containing protein [Mucilaginibacter sp.]|uniref:DUF4296 domain-containing protein n=1 Tax=Mucilaginibacter sp. TaxID=1882438 RepID=UPI002601F453|nr:DUF4296 domain-containing protein [Mucilaginibacter sp.]MDB4926011.1 hypothetical protein [Mucilaginibacter sp.]